MTDHSADLAPDGIDAGYLRGLVADALAEDLAGGIDITTAATIGPEQSGALDLVARQPGVIAGLAVAAVAFERVAGTSSAEVELAVADGDRVVAGQRVLTARGRVLDLLTAERTALNFLGHLSGVATATRAWADALSSTEAYVRDTRKTTPGLRLLEKYAVRCGGGRNHRMSLSDAALVKDNHVVAAGGVAAAFKAVRRQYPDVTVEVEVDSLDQLCEVLDAGAELVLLDNFDVDRLRSAVDINGGRAILEASGGLTLDGAREVAETGVDYLAVGALTHSSPVLDIGADLRED